MQARVMIGLGTALLLVGCATVRRPAATAGGELPPEDRDFIEALAHYADGLILEAENRRDDPRALEAFLAAIEHDPQTPLLYSKAAIAALQRRDIPAAIEILERACKANPRAAQPRIDLAVTSQLTGQIDRAIDSYRDALRLDPSRTIVYEALARLYFFREQDDEGLKTLELACKRTSDTSRIAAFAFNQARYFVERQDAKRALPLFRFVGRHVEGTQRQAIHQLIGNLCSDLGDDAAAADAYRKAIESDPAVPDAYVSLAMIQAEKDPVTAIETLKTAGNLFTNNPAVLFPLAYVYALGRDYTNSLPLFERAYTLLKDGDPRELPASFYIQYGAACEQAGDRKRAVEVFETCIELYPTAHEALNYVAYMWSEQGLNLEQARGYVTRALVMEPRNGAYVDTLGWILFKMGKFPEARIQIEKAAELIKDDPTVLDHLGDVNKALDRTPEAVEAWKRSFALDANQPAVAEKLRKHGIDPATLPPLPPAEAERGEK